MVKVTFSPGRDFPRVKRLMICIGLLTVMIAIILWYQVIIRSEPLSSGVAGSCFGAVLVYATLLFVNYDITFVGDELVVTNWLKRKRKYVLTTLDKQVYMYYALTTMYVVFYDKDHRKTLKTKYGNKVYLSHLESIGFDVKPATKISMFF